MHQLKSTTILSNLAQLRIFTPQRQLRKGYCHHSSVRPSVCLSVSAIVILAHRFPSVNIAIFLDVSNIPVDSSRGVCFAGPNFDITLVFAGL